MEDDHLNELLQKMSDSGLIEYNWENKRHAGKHIVQFLTAGYVHIAEVLRQNS